MQVVPSILEKQLPNWILEIYDISNLHAGHNNFDGSGELSSRTPFARLWTAIH